MSAARAFKPPLPATREAWTELEALARSINPKLPADLSGYQIRITLSKDFQGVELIEVIDVAARANSRGST